MTPEEPELLLDISENVGTIRLNRPKALNALTSDLMVGVVEAARSFDNNPEVAAIVIAGSERAFAAGADITEMSAFDYSSASDTDLFAGWNELTRVRKPLIAAVRGYALGGGCELAMLCDILVAGPNSIFGQPEIELAIIPGMGGSQRLTRAIGRPKAMEMILTGRRINGEEADRLGLISRLVADDKVESTAREIALSIALKSAPVVRAAKVAVGRPLDDQLSGGLELERQLFYAMFGLDDRREGMRAFLAKEQPDFTNR